MKAALGVFYDSAVSPAVTPLSPDWISWGRSEPCITVLCAAMAGSWIFHLAALMRRGSGSKLRGVWAPCSSRQLGEDAFRHTQGHSEGSGFGGTLCLQIVTVEFRAVRWGLKVILIFGIILLLGSQTGFIVWGDGRSCVLSFYCFVFHSDTPVCALPSNFIWKLHVLAAPMVIITGCGHLLKARWGCVSLSYFILLAFGPWH